MSTRSSNPRKEDVTQKSLTGEEWWLELFYWDLGNIKQFNLCDTWRILYIPLVKLTILVFILLCMVVAFILSALLFWCIPDLKSSAGFRLLPFAYVFGVRWGNFLPSLWILSLFFLNTKNDVPLYENTFAVIVISWMSLLIFAIVDFATRNSLYSTLRVEGSLIEFLFEKFFDFVGFVFTPAEKYFLQKEIRDRDPPKEEKVTFWQVVKLKTSTWRERVCFTIPIVREEKRN